MRRLLPAMKVTTWSLSHQVRAARPETWSSEERRDSEELLITNNHSQEEDGVDHSLAALHVPSVPPVQSSIPSVLSAKLRHHRQLLIMSGACRPVRPTVIKFLLDRTEILS